MSAGGTIHATAVLLDAAGVLIRGPSGSGKSRLALVLLDEAEGRGRFAALVADDRVRLDARGGRLIARCPETIAGMAEMRGRGIVTRRHEPAAVIRLVVDLLPAGELARMPEDEALTAVVEGVRIARQPVPAGDAECGRLLVRQALAEIGW